VKLLITGGAGFIGANFLHHPVAAHPDYDVVVVDAFTYAGPRSNVAPVLEQILVVEADICDEAAMNEVMAGCDVVVHFAAESHVDPIY
jgi:dTDP-glucose 4,6-dehydratase